MQCPVAAIVWAIPERLDTLADDKGFSLKGQVTIMAGKKTIKDMPAGNSPQEALGNKAYEKELKQLHVELVKLQQWVVHKGLKVCIDVYKRQHQCH